LLWREASDLLPEELIFNVNYLGGQMPSFTEFLSPAVRS
jgi:glutamate/tyrosine decarboxylase-like PLP-dependent enzyme